MDVVIAVLNRPEGVQALLEAGARLLEIGGGGRLTALAVRMPPLSTILPSEEVLTAGREAAIRAEQESWAGSLRGIVQQWAPTAQSRGIDTGWVDVEGDAASVVAEHGRRADAIVVSRPASHEAERMRDAVHAALFDTGRPVLVVPPGWNPRFGKTVAIAWKDDARAVKAVHAALPILRHAGRVVVLCARRAAEMPAILAEHGIGAELVSVPDGDAPVGEQLLQAAGAAGADLLVMGAFAHGEWRERVFGGVTRTVLGKADLPLLLRH
ncbi:MAG TPA: universal stress protein [Acetobacteraceae bacterium]|nr:universal stress protein [Acetobacteraceae bacterium]